MNAASIRTLRRAGEHEEARSLAVELSLSCPMDGLVQYEAACTHDFLGLEAQAAGYYVEAIAAGLPTDELRGAYLGLGSTYRVLGKYDDSIKTFDEARAKFPAACELVVFRAMTLHNLDRSKEAVEALLSVLAETSKDNAINDYKRAITLYAEDVERIWAR